MAPTTRSLSAEARLFNPDPAAYLPHRYPFLILDRILERNPGISAQAHVRIPAGQGHFPDIMMIECIAQLGGIMSFCEEGLGGFIASIDQAEFSGSAEAGDTLLVEVRMIKSFGRLFMLEGSVASDAGILLKGRLTLGVGTLSS